MKKRITKIIHHIASLRVAIALLLLIAAYIVIGTLLPQHSAHSYYLERYVKTGPLIIALTLDKAYSSPLFIILLVLFSINLTLCTATTLKAQIRQLKGTFFPAVASSEFVVEGVDEEAVRSYSQRMRFNVVERDGEIRAGKMRIGVLGAAITHVGIILLFLGGAIGNMSSSEEMVNLLPGNEHRFEAQGFTLTLDDFHMTFDESGAVKQYISTVTVTDDDGSQRSDRLWVNKPFHYKGLGFYQANYNWASNLRIVERESREVVAEGLMRNGGSYFYQSNHLTVQLYGYYPELGIGHQQQPVKISDREIDPYYAVVLYQFGEAVGSYIVAPNQHIHWEDLEISFTHSVAYTGLLVRKDLSYPIVLASFLIMIAGLFISFYLYPRFLLFKEGKLYTYSRRNGWVFYQSIRSAFTKKE
ncbi:MAG: cytochrome c biogenesis protein ResB [Sphaerochaeta sp.]|jgi:cytochrome c biogenesis protein|nr:cytochrome c biogenesis protein ResB [Sphaerochaeta sp.]MDX9914809.1 cytochrome c biogenesis protein ResB [Sphaerochaeta sp.]